jgi:Spy/CpxP family protein refolding chaperone
MQNRQPNSSRRSFFAGAATVGAAAAAVTALPHVAPSPTVAEAVRVAPEKGGGYHLSAHVKQYYKTTQI